MTQKCTRTRIKKSREIDIMITITRELFKSKWEIMNLLIKIHITLSLQLWMVFCFPTKLFTPLIHSSSLIPSNKRTKNHEKIEKLMTTSWSTSEIVSLSPSSSASLLPHTLHLRLHQPILNIRFCYQIALLYQIALQLIELKKPISSTKSRMWMITWMRWQHHTNIFLEWPLNLNFTR